jgi:transposase
LELADALGNTSKVCKEWGVARSTFYLWKKAYAKEGVASLIRKKPIPNSHPKQLRPEVVEKILYLRRTYHLSPKELPGMLSVTMVSTHPVQAFTGLWCVMV